MLSTLEKLTTQFDSGLLESLSNLAKAECHQIQAVLEDALREKLDAKKVLMAVADLVYFFYRKLADMHFDRCQTCVGKILGLHQ